MNKKIIFTAFMLLPLYVTSQELDQAYLDSLPEEIKNDVLEKVELKEELEQPVYRRASSRLDKDLEDENYKMFGAKFFDTIQTSFMPVNEPNLDGSYILDFGDALEIQLVGQKDSIDTYAIKRDGSINLPDIGTIVLSGLSLNDASSLIKAKVNNTFIGTEAFISLKNIRDISVLIVGNAYNPGIYTVNGNSSIIHALAVAGGIDDIGSYRNISLVRNGEIIKTLDLYDVLVYGKYDFSISLRSGDSIVVNQIGNVVSIESGVKRNLSYELKDGESFQDLLRFSSGFSSNANIQNIVIKRVYGGINQVINLSLDELNTFELINNDSIFIPEYKLNNIFISGAIKNPGNYKVFQGTTLSEMINIAGGYDDTAYPFGGYLENKKALEINKVSKEKLYQTYLNNIINNTAGSQQIDIGTLDLIRQLRSSTVTGRVIAEFDLDVIANDPSLDTSLEDEDKIFIPIISQQVYIHGEVSNSGAIRYTPGKDIEYYIEKSGGALDTADLKNIFVVNPNGETKTINSSSPLSFVILDNDVQLIYPGSIIYIPQSAKLMNPAQAASIWAPIISSIALSLTSLSVLNNNN
ncbi:MAG: hypothetical protein CMD58_04185 [Gammaproteobacteria bacterium]|nr:hypothetical protein [Gammaproteobacteria bacterium]